jgi:hypothetical protein
MLRWLFLSVMKSFLPCSIMVQGSKHFNHLDDDIMIKTWDQEICFLSSLMFEPCDCSYNDHWRLTWSLTSGPVGLVEMRANWPGHPHTTKKIPSIMFLFLFLFHLFLLLFLPKKLFMQCLWHELIVLSIIIQGFPQVYLLTINRWESHRYR